MEPRASSKGHDELQALISSRRVLDLQERIKQQNGGSNKFLHRGDGKMDRMLGPSIKLIG